MNAATITAITAVLSLIEQFVIPLVTKGGTTDQVNKVIDVLEKLLPIIGNQISVFYQIIKNMIAALSATPGTPQEQLARLQALDAQVDTAFDAAAADVDPDAPAAN